MASVNGHKIYRTEVDKYYANQTAGSDQQPAGEQAVSLRLSILNELIETEILMQRRKARFAGHRRRSGSQAQRNQVPYTPRNSTSACRTRKSRSTTSSATCAAPHPRQGAEQGNHLAHQYHRPGREQLLQRTQGRVQPDRSQYHLAKIMVLESRIPRFITPEQQGAERGRSAQENRDDRQPPR